MPGQKRVFGELIEAIYEAVLDPTQWQVVLKGLSSAIGGETPVLFGHDRDLGSGGVRLAVACDADWIRDYNAYYSARNVWLKGGRHLLKSGAVRTSQMMCSQRELERSEFYSDFLRRIGLTQGLGATIWHEGSLSYNLTIMRSAKATPFAAEELALVRALMPHLRRSIQIYRRLSTLVAKERSQAEALDHIPAGLILVDGRQRVVFSNRSARETADAADGLRVVDGRLTCDRPAESKRLHDMVRQAASARAAGNPAGGGVMRISRHSPAPPLSILVTSLAIASDFLVGDPPVAAVFVFDHSAPGESAESVLTRLHGLTRAEARVVGRLLSGTSLDAAADQLSISIHTARTHLKSALAKTGTNRQTELLRRVLTGPASFLPTPGSSLRVDGVEK
jgi:DNA-binding CsgD family transcriptional regulator